MKTKEYYGDIEVLMTMRLRVQMISKSKPTKASMLQALKDSTYDDITDEEHLEYLEIKKMDMDESELAAEDEE